MSKPKTPARRQAERMSQALRENGYKYDAVTFLEAHLKQAERRAERRSRRKP